MVRTLVEGLGATGEFEVHHVNLGLSRDVADIGAFRWGKLVALFGACLRAWGVRWKHGAMALYYVPAPGKRGALWRDCVVMLLCRPFFPRLILHWHAVGLGGWLTLRATQLERLIARPLLRKADLSILLATELGFDAKVLEPRRTAVVANGVVDPGVGPARARTNCCEVLFIGLCSRAKGFFATLEAVARANERVPGGFRLTAAGEFSSAADEEAFRARAVELGGSVRHVGFADEVKKRALFQAADVLCFPTTYPHEGQPLVLIEALAHDVPIITTRWRAIPGMLPPENVWFVEPKANDALVEALLIAKNAPKRAGILREHFLRYYGFDRHLEKLREALRSVPAK